MFDIMNYVGKDSDNVLMHYGVGHLDGGNSGRYPWGSGDSPYQRSGDWYSRYKELHKQGLTDAEIGEQFGLSSNQVRAYRGIAVEINRRLYC